MLQNQVTLIGHLGADLKAFTTAEGKTVASGRLAVSNRYTDRSGNAVDDTQWFSVVAFGSRAERLLHSVRRGDRVCIAGRLSVSRYDDKAGQPRERTQIVVTSFEQLPGLAERKAAVARLAAEAEAAVATDSTLAADEVLTVPTKSNPTRVVELDAKHATKAKTPRRLKTAA